jgi:diadenosine tetraphosphate (Ap4A) HIT family hydrolase
MVTLVRKVAMRRRVGLSGGADGDSATNEAPKQQIESWVDELDEAGFLALQRVVYQVAKAVAATVPTERMYSLSLGSQQGNSHLHWHVAPLPPGVPYREQQFHALMAENGVLDVDDRSQASLAEAIGQRIRLG